MASSQNVQLNANQAVQRGEFRHAQTNIDLHAPAHQEMPNSEAMKASQIGQQMYMTQPSQDTVAWSEETQADPPVTCLTSINAMPYVQLTMPKALPNTGQQPIDDTAAAPEPSDNRAAAAAPVPTSRLRLKMKSLAAAAAINSAAAAENAVSSPAADGIQHNVLAEPSGTLHAQSDAAQSADAPAELAPAQPNSLHDAIVTQQEASIGAAAQAAVKAAAEASRAAVEQAKQAVAAAADAQGECKAMAASAITHVTAEKDRQECRHAEVLGKVIVVQESCSTPSTNLANLQTSCDTQAAKLSSVESTCQTLLGLMHKITAQTQQALNVFQAQQVQQPAVTMLRCLDTATQTSPVQLSHQAVQAELLIPFTQVCNRLICCTTACTNSLYIHVSTTCVFLTATD